MHIFLQDHWPSIQKEMCIFGSVFVLAAYISPYCIAYFVFTFIIVCVGGSGLCGCPASLTKAQAQWRGLQAASC